MLADPIVERRQPYPMFWWWTAAFLAGWQTVRGRLEYMISPPPFVREPIMECLDIEAVRRAAGWRHVAGDIAELLGDALFYAAPGVLVFLALIVKRFGPGRPEVHLRAARWGFAVVLLPTPLSLLEDALNPVQWNRDCLASMGIVEGGADYVGLALAWLVSAEVAVLLAGAAGTRARPGRGLPIALAAVTAVVVCAQVIAALPKPYEAPAAAADGTPAHVLISSAGRSKNWSDGSTQLYVLDLTAGKIVDSAPAPGRDFMEYTTVVRDTRPGHYLAAAATMPSGDWWSPRGRTSRIYRLALDEQGRAQTTTSVSADMEGVITGLAVAESGRIAYTRVVADKDDKYSSFAGLLDSEKEWPISTSSSLQWTDGTTLVLPSDRRSDTKVIKTRSGPKFQQGEQWLVTLDSATGTPGRLPIDSDAQNDGLFARLPGGRTIVADVYDEDPSVRPQLILYDGRTAVGTVFTASRGRIISMTLDATGRHLLVGQDNQNDVYAMPTDTDYELIRIDLAPATGIPPTGTRRDLGLAKQVVWSGAQPLAAIAW